MNRPQSIISALVTLIVACAGFFGFSLDTDMRVDVLSLIAFFGAFAWGIYKNHNFTDASNVAQEYLAMLKNTVNGSASDEELIAVAEAHGDNRGE